MLICRCTRRRGDWYLHSRSAHRNAKVIEAYRQLQVETDRLYMLFTRTVHQWATRVVFTRCGQPYETDEELICAVRANGTLEITSAVAVGERLHPLLGCEFGGALTGSALSMTSSVMAGTDTASIWPTSAQPGELKTGYTAGWRRWLLRPRSTE